MSEKSAWPSSPAPPLPPPCLAAPRPCTSILYPRPYSPAVSAKRDLLSHAYGGITFLTHEGFPPSLISRSSFFPYFFLNSVLLVCVVRCRRLLLSYFQGGYHCHDLLSLPMSATFLCSFLFCLVFLCVGDSSFLTVFLCTVP